MGGVFGAVSVPTSQGLDVTFNTYQYGGRHGRRHGFVLAAVDPANPQAPANIGQSGGALGYTATSTALPGLAYGYLGIGLDVFGNYSNSLLPGHRLHQPGLHRDHARVPGQVVVRGPGNGTVGYCAINSTATTTASPPSPCGRPPARPVSRSRSSSTPPSPRSPPPPA